MGGDSGYGWGVPGRWGGVLYDLNGNSRKGFGKFGDRVCKEVLEGYRQVCPNQLVEHHVFQMCKILACNMDRFNS